MQYSQILGTKTDNLHVGWIIDIILNRLAFVSVTNCLGFYGHEMPVMLLKVWRDWPPLLLLFIEDLWTSCRRRPKNPSGRCCWLRLGPIPNSFKKRRLPEVRISKMNKGNGVSLDGVEQRTEQRGLRSLKFPGSRIPTVLSLLLDLRVMPRRCMLQLHPKLRREMSGAVRKIEEIKGRSRS